MVISYHQNYFLFLENLGLSRWIFKIIFYSQVIHEKVNVNKLFEVFLELFHVQSLILQNHFKTQRH